MRQGITKCWEESGAKDPPRPQSRMFKTCIQHRKKIANWASEKNEHWQQITAKRKAIMIAVLYMGIWKCNNN